MGLFIDERSYFFYTERENNFVMGWKRSFYIETDD